MCQVSPAFNFQGVRMSTETKKSPVSEETRNQMEAVKQLVNIFDLLNLATFQGTFSKRVADAQHFVKRLHENAFKTLENAPDYEELLKEGKEVPK